MSGIIGDNTVRTLNDGGGDTGIAMSTKQYCSINGTISKMTVYLTGGASGRHACFAIYADTGGTKSQGYPIGSPLAYTASVEVTGTGWVDFPLVTPLAVTAGTFYWFLESVDSDSLSFQYDHDGTIGSANCWSNMSYNSWATIGSGWAQGGQYLTDISFSWYATYTAASSGQQLFCLLNMMGY
jgi:hypothetical protein